MLGLSSAGFAGCGKKPSRCHSERSEESLLDQKSKEREIPRPDAGLGMTNFLFLRILFSLRAFLPAMAKSKPRRLKPTLPRKSEALD
jgi:hypothetical protein